MVYLVIVLVEVIISTLKHQKWMQYEDIINCEFTMCNRELDGSYPTSQSDSNLPKVVEAIHNSPNYPPRSFEGIQKFYITVEMCCKMPIFASVVYNLYLPVHVWHCSPCAVQCNHFMHKTT